MSGASASPSRRASLRTIVRRAFTGEAKLSRGSTVLVAVSGGPDSMALLDVAASLAESFGLIVHAHGVDHGLRTSAGAELDLAASLAERLGVPFGRTATSVGRGGNLQARARAARWEALAGAARGCGAVAIATAHHADDRAETLLLRLLRGAGARGLAVMPPRAPAPGARDLEVVRPLLRARKADIHAHVMRRRLSHAEDPSNADPRFLRTRVRRELMPLLEALDPAVVRHLEQLSDELLEHVEPRSGPAADVLPPEAASLAWAAGLPRATQVALGSLLRSRASNARVWLPGGLVVARDARARSRGGATSVRAKA